VSLTLLVRSIGRSPPAELIRARAGHAPSAAWPLVNTALRRWRYGFLPLGSQPKAGQAGSAGEGTSGPVRPSLSRRSL
jgi:hypothetical protein